MRYLILVGFLLGIAFSAQAQSTRDVDAPKPPPPQYQSYKKEKKLSNFFSRLFSKKDKTEVDVFRERVNENYRKKARAARKANKKQFKDPTYFGHRKPPKKRPPGKQKFCKECGMVH